MLKKAIADHYWRLQIFFIILAGPIPLRVREAQIPVVNDNECVRKINAVTEKIFILPASSFCAGGEEGHDACQVINKKMILEKICRLIKKICQLSIEFMTFLFLVHKGRWRWSISLRRRRWLLHFNRTGFLGIWLWTKRRAWCICKDFLLHRVD